jgi:hypothetical protein
MGTSTCSHSTNDKLTQHQQRLCNNPAATPSLTQSALHSHGMELDIMMLLLQNQPAAKSNKTTSVMNNKVN